MENIAKAIIEVMRAVKGVEKNSTIGSGRYSYKGTKDQDVKQAYLNAMADNGLCILPIDIQEETKTERWKEGDKVKQSVFTKVVTKYLLLHTSGESQILSGYGHSTDPQDKGAGKATTYAMKYCLLYTFMTPVGDIDDTDNTHSQEMPTPPKKMPIYPVANYPKAAQSIKDGVTSFDDIRNVYVVSTAAEKTINEMIKKLK